jgi:ERCC4-type nuclease
MVLKMKGREPTREAALKRNAEAYDTYLEQQHTMAMSMPNTGATSELLLFLFK